MKHWLSFLAASTALAGCTAGPQPEVATPVAAGEAAAPAPVPAPKPAYGEFGFDTVGMDSTSQPGDNFYQYANGTWVRTTAIPADKSNYGMFTVLDDLSKERTRTIIEETTKDPSSKIGNAYNAFLDTAAIDAKGLAPFEPWLNEVRGLSNRSDLAALYAKADRMGLGTPFAFYVGQDDKNPDRYVTGLAQAGIGMPDRDYYLSNDPKIAEVRAKYLQHVTNVLALAGEANASARAKAIRRFREQHRQSALDAD